jgi:hypothetical protein
MNADLRGWIFLTLIRVYPRQSAANFSAGLLDYDESPRIIFPSRCGPIAQLVEQLTLNQRVAGSSPARLTKTPQSESLIVRPIAEDISDRNRAF